MIITYILGTDMAKHADSVNALKTMAQGDP